MASFTSTAIAFSALLSVAFGGLLIIEAGTSGKMGPKLENGFKFCPEDFSSRGFSIECRLPERTMYADITVNGNRVREGSAPYHAAGDRGVSVNPLMVPAGDIEVSCKGSTGVMYTVTGMITCDMPDMMMMSPSPMMMMEMTPSPYMMSHTDMAPMVTMAPTPMVERAMPSTTPTATAAMIPAATATASAMPSYSPTPSMSMMVEEAKDVVPKKDETTEYPPMMEEMPKSEGSYCVTKEGTDVMGEIAPGWVASGSAVSYKPGSDFGGTVKPVEGETNVYKFKVPYTSTYAVVIDMTTSAGSEHNDVWIRCDGGFNLRRKNNPPATASGFTKAYHNDVGRAKLSRSIDHNPHAMSTSKTLMPGQTYTCEIAGRSTKTTVHGIIMFPCKGAECQVDSQVWKDGLEKCDV